MKRVAVTALMVAFGMAGAQTWDLSEGRLQLTGCASGQDGVYCDFNYTLTKKQTSRLNFNYTDFKVFTTDGTSRSADTVSLAGRDFSRVPSSVEIIANVPVNVRAYFNIPTTTVSFRALEINKVRLNNVAVRTATSAQPAAPTPLPAAVGVKGFSISLSNCTLQGQNYICTATLTPTK